MDVCATAVEGKRKERTGQCLKTPTISKIGLYQNLNIIQPARTGRRKSKGRGRGRGKSKGRGRGKSKGRGRGKGTKKK
jgi:hypothetical protein